MTVEVTLRVPDTLLEGAKRMSSVTQRKVETVLADALELLWPMVEDLPAADLHPQVADLSDAEVLALADSKMEPTQNQRLGALQAKGKETDLSLAERYELMALLHIYQIGQLHKSEGLAEAVRRGLRPPLSA